MSRRKSAELQHQNTMLLEMAVKMARLGGWVADLAGYRVTLSDAVCAIHGLPAGTVLTVEEAIRLYAPDSRGRIRAVFEACASEGGWWGRTSTSN